MSPFRLRYLVAVDDCFLDNAAGAARVAWDFAQIVQQAGGVVGMVCLVNHQDAPTYEVTEYKGIRILRVKRPVLFSWDMRRLEKTIQCVADAVAATMSAEDWDLIHTHTCVAGLGTIQALPGPRVIKTIHSPMKLEFLANNADGPWLGRLKRYFGLPLLSRLEHRELTESHAIHALSQFTVQEITKEHGQGFAISVVPHWRRKNLVRTMSKAEARIQLGWDPDETIFFSLRYHGPRNGLDVAIEAIAPLTKAGRCRCFLGGGGTLWDYHAQLIAALGVEDRVHLMGRLSEEELLLAYQACDVFLLPTRALECFGLIILEAFAFGCPVLGTTAGAIPELIAPISPDLLFPPDDVGAMRAKIEGVLDGSLSLPSGQVLLDYLEQRFGYDLLVPKYLAWFQKIAASEYL